MSSRDESLVSLLPKRCITHQLVLVLLFMLEAEQRILFTTWMIASVFLRSFKDWTLGVPASWVSDKDGIKTKLADLSNLDDLLSLGAGHCCHESRTTNGQITPVIFIETS